jgi:hypothetical protein
MCCCKPSVIKVKSETYHWEMFMEMCKINEHRFVEALSMITKNKSCCIQFVDRFPEELVDIVLGYSKIGTEVIYNEGFIEIFFDKKK